jgi:hypothetical protein
MVHKVRVGGELLLLLLLLLLLMMMVVIMELLLQVLLVVVLLLLVLLLLLLLNVCETTCLPNSITSSVSVSSASGGADTFFKAARVQSTPSTYVQC